MKTANFLTSSCRHCRYYQSEGRRGGSCQQLGVPVESHWKACTLSVRSFDSTWEDVREVVNLEHSLSLACVGKCESHENAQTKIQFTEQPILV